VLPTASDAAASRRVAQGAGCAWRREMARSNRRIYFDYLACLSSVACAHQWRPRGGEAGEGALDDEAQAPSEPKKETSRRDGMRAGRAVKENIILAEDGPPQKRDDVDDRDQGGDGGPACPCRVADGVAGHRRIVCEEPCGRSDLFRCISWRWPSAAEGSWRWRRTPVRCAIRSLQCLHTRAGP